MALTYPAMLPVRSRKNAEMINITADINELIPADFSGICHVFCQHTTAAVTINENADPDVVRDMLGELERIAPWQNTRFRHSEGNSAAHVKASLIGSDVAVPTQEGRLMLGTWQGIFFCEFDGPRSRHVVVQLTPGL